MFKGPEREIKHYNVVVSTDNGTSIQTASTPSHASLFLENAMQEDNAGRVTIIVEPYYGN